MSQIFELMKKYDCEELHFRYDPKTKLRAIIAINSTKRGSMCSGGVRMRNYKNEDEALWDALNLSLAMTQKCAAIKANVGGGKAIIWNTPKEKNADLLTCFAKFMCSLGGRFRTAVDVGLNHEDGETIIKTCPYVEGQPEKYGGLGTEGDTTAIGVIKAMKSGCKYLFGNKSLKGKIIALQGLGNVGSFMVEFLIKEKAILIIADTDGKIVKDIKMKHPSVKTVSPNEILFQKCDILSPCAIGGILNSKTIPKLRCGMICGAANNQLYKPKSDIRLIEKRGILFLPDFIVNAGGIIQAIVEINKGTKRQAIRNTKIIEKNIAYILGEHKKTRKNTLEIAHELIDTRLK